MDSVAMSVSRFGQTVVRVLTRAARYLIDNFRKLVRLVSSTITYAKDMKLMCKLRKDELCYSDSGASLCAYVIKIVSNPTNKLAIEVNNFVGDTRVSDEKNPYVLMRNIKLFMSRMKISLIQETGYDLDQCMEPALEEVLHSIVVQPLRDHLYRLFVEAYTRAGTIDRLAQSMSLVRPCTIQELGARQNILPPSRTAVNAIRGHLSEMQRSNSVMKKIENLLLAVKEIYNSVHSVTCGKCGPIGADDFLPLFVWVLVQTGMVAVEIEAQYLTGLIPQSLMVSEGGYYLTMLCTAIYIIRNHKPKVYYDSDKDTGYSDSDKDTGYSDFEADDWPEDTGEVTHASCDLTVHQLRVN